MYLLIGVTEMKWFKRILAGFLVLLVILAVALFFYINHISKKALPDYNRDMVFNGLKKPVVVYRDSYAVPHIFADSEEDLYRVVGYVMAQDRLWQMDLLRRVTTGRLSELFGNIALDTDILMRSLRIPEKSMMILSNSDTKVKQALEAFADGVNLYIREHESNLPPEFTLLRYKPEKWEPIHSVNLVGYMAWGLTMGWSAESLLQELGQRVNKEKFKDMIPDNTIHQTVVFPDYKQNPVTETEKDLRSMLLERSDQLVDLGLGVFNGSNNWAVSGKKSLTGKPILANDMHLELSAPALWYQVHQKVLVENGLDVTGVILPGQPFVISGHNNRIAWGMTNLMVDDIDFYKENISPDNPNQYKFNGTWRSMIIKKEKFRIKKSEVIEKELRFTHRGPVISDFRKRNGEIISMHWIGNEMSNELRSVYLLNHAKNWEDFRDSLKTFISISQNFVYADVDGNIGLQTGGGIPIRKGNGIDLQRGDTDEYDWTGFVPFEELPYSYNPESGYVSSANNRTVNNDYKYYISSWFDIPNRIDRIREMLESKEKLGVDDFEKMQADFKSKHVEHFLGDILNILKQDNAWSDHERKAIKILSNWDGTLKKSSSAAVIFEKMYLVMIKHLVKGELGNELYKKFIGSKLLVENLILNVWKNKESAWLKDMSFEKWIKSSFKETIEFLRSKYGSNPDTWQWGKIHRVLLKHPLGSVKWLDKLFHFNIGPYGVGGSYHTVCPYNYSFRDPFISEFGASQRHVYSTADWDSSATVIPTGISGIPSSSHYSDQVRLYLGNKYHEDMFSKEEIVKKAKYKCMFTPGKTHE